MPDREGVGSRSFETTHWSLVARAGDAGGDAQRRALGDLVQRYLPALRSHLIVRRQMKPHDADDVLQEFVAAKVVEQGLVGQARRERGKFRSFLLTSLDRFAISRGRHDRAKKRSSGTTPLSVHEEFDAPDPAADSPDSAFDVAWAKNLLTEALRQMREECDRTHRPDVWGVFEARMLGPMLNQVPPEPYERLVERFALASPAQASNVLITAKRMFERAVRSRIAEYEPDEANIDAEIADLQTILSRRTG